MHWGIVTDELMEDPVAAIHTASDWGLKSVELRGLGRGFVLLTLLSPLNGSGRGGILAGLVLDQLQLKYSRRQERAADEYAAGLLLRKYGRIEGGLNLLRKFGDTDKAPEVFYYFSTHPPPAERIENIRALR